MFLPSWSNTFFNSCYPYLARFYSSNMMLFGGGIFGRQLGHEDEALINGISASEKRPQKAYLPPSVMWGHREKMAFYEPACGLTRHKICPRLRNVRNKCLRFIRHSVYGSCDKAANGLRQLLRWLSSDPGLQHFLPFHCNRWVSHECHKVALWFSHLAFNCLLTTLRLQLSFPKMSFNLTVYYWNLLSLYLLFPPPFHPLVSKSLVYHICECTPFYLYTILVLLQLFIWKTGQSPYVKDSVFHQ